MLTNGSQNATDTYAYDAWGNTVSSSGHLANPLQYAAAVYDPTTSLYDMRARFYDPASGGGHRFLSPDPLGGGYAYVGDSPANYVDPTGMKACDARGRCWYRQSPPTQGTPGPPSCSLSQELNGDCPNTSPGRSTQVAGPSQTCPNWGAVAAGVGILAIYAGVAIVATFFTGGLIWFDPTWWEFTAVMVIGGGISLGAGLTQPCSG